ERIARSYRRIHWINPPPATPKPANIVCMTWWAQLTVANVHDATPRTVREGAMLGVVATAIWLTTPGMAAAYVEDSVVLGAAGEGS
ncbi:hypothetical protein, partial [Cryobacterium zongtaii]|uniref:hypothetical protein n=1 Tax=Cryobacterium zongtaii TaxID=1259217 RepID=UPI001A9E1F92